MYICDTHYCPDRDEIVVETREASGFVAMLALAVDELCCTHPGRDCRDAFCLIDPKPWAWNLGIGWRLSVGRAMWMVGQWAAGHPHRLPVVRTESVTREEAVTVWGWREEDIDGWEELDEDG